MHEGYVPNTEHMKDAQFYAYFRLWTILVCSCNQSHVQDKLNLAITMVTSYDFMPIATEVHESHTVRI